MPLFGRRASSACVSIFGQNMAAGALLTYNNQYKHKFFWGGSYLSNHHVNKLLVKSTVLAGSIHGLNPIGQPVNPHFSIASPLYVDKMVGIMPNVAFRDQKFVILIEVNAQ
jgi:hypothetical protein